MNKLEEAAREHADGFERVDPGQDESIQSARIVGFKRGAEWQAKQSPWIKAKDQLPPVDENYISQQSSPVLVKVAAKGHYEPEILVYNKHYHVWDTADADDFSCNISDDDAWMPIPE